MSHAGKTFTLNSQALEQEPAMVAMAFLNLFTDSDFLDMESSVADLERFMSHISHHLVPLRDLDGQVFGVVSGTDLIAFHSGGGNPLATKAWEICSHKLIKADIGTPMEALAQLFVAHGIHHVLLTRRERIIGMTSTMDVCRYLMEQSRPADAERLKLHS